MTRRVPSPAESSRAWYECCVVQSGEVRDVIVESNLRDAKARLDKMAVGWPDCEYIFVRQHRLDKKRGPGASTFVVLHKLTLDFRVTQVSA